MDGRDVFAVLIYVFLIVIKCHFPDGLLSSFELSAYNLSILIFDFKVFVFDCFSWCFSWRTCDVPSIFSNDG